MNLKKKRPPPKCITVRDYKKLDLEAFRHDLATAPFYFASVLDDADDVQWAWQNLFDNIGITMPLGSRLRLEAHPHRG